MKQSPKFARRHAFSLVEMIVTSVLIGMIVIGIVPLFTRAIINNAYGADASQLASFLRSGAERIQQRSANDPSFSQESYSTAVAGEAVGGEVLTSDANVTRLAPTYFDTGARNSVTKADDMLGDERWISFSTATTGHRLWRQRREIREYSVADVFRGNVSVASGSATLLPLGNPKLFDNPQPRTGRADITEVRIIVESVKGGLNNNEAALTATGIKQMSTVNVHRAF